MRSKFAIISSIPTDPPKRAIRSRMEKTKAHKKALVRNETHLSDPRDHLRNYNISFQKLYKNLRIDG